MIHQEPPVAPSTAGDLISGHTFSEPHGRRSASFTESVLNPQGFRAAVGLDNVARRTLGIFLLLVTVFLWTTSNFLASVGSPSIYRKKWPLTWPPSVYVCRRHILEAVLRHVLQHVVFCDIFDPNIP